MRLEKLAGFQIKILKHALNNFRQAKRVVYSTCSVYKEENEEVVKEVLASCRNYKLVSAQKLLNGPWQNFGSEEYGNIGKYCLYARPNNDLTNGFFVAVFERLEGKEDNPDFVVNLEKNERGKKRKRKNKNQDDIEFVEQNETEQKLESNEAEERQTIEEKSKKKKHKKRKQESNNVCEDAEITVTEKKDVSRDTEGNNTNKDVEEKTNDNSAEVKKKKKKHKKHKNAAS